MTSLLSAFLCYCNELFDAILNDHHPHRIGFSGWTRRWKCVCGQAVKLHDRFDLKPDSEWVCPHCAAPSWTAKVMLGRRAWGTWEWKEIPSQNPPVEPK
jgi:hypothetical protein